MFEKCHSLISLPDISKWNISNIIDMRRIFENCNSLISLPDISKWNNLFDGALNNDINILNYTINSFK